MIRPASSAAAPVFAEPILSPRRARTEFEQRVPSPFLVERAETTRAEQDLESAEGVSRGDVRLVLRGVARYPVLTAWIAALAGMTAIGLFLGLMLGELAIG